MALPFIIYLEAINKNIHVHKEQMGWGLSATNKESSMQLAISYKPTSSGTLCVMGLAAIIQVTFYSYQVSVFGGL